MKIGLIDVDGHNFPNLALMKVSTYHKSIGRIARDFEEKQDPICYDFVDDIGYLIKSYKKRCTTYRKNKCCFIEEGGT